MDTTANSSGRAAELKYPTVLIWTGLTLVAVLAWSSTLHDAWKMGKMPGTMGLEAADYIVMWTIMMAAMMLPSLAPIASMYLRVIHNQSTAVTRVLRIASFVTGYLLIWALFGVIAYLVSWSITRLLVTSPEMLTWVTAAVLLSCGLYQFTPFKSMCLTHCQSPLGFLFHFGNYRGMFRDLQVGIYHGGYCTGCCFGLMLIMIFTGVMNITWMIALALIIFIEKVWHYGTGFARAVGLVLIVLGCMLPWYPHILQSIPISE